MMIQVKEFLNYQEGQETKINEWLQEKGDSIEVVDIKYSIGIFQESVPQGWTAQETSGALIIYKIKATKDTNQSSPR